MPAAATFSTLQQARQLLERQACGNARCSCTRSARRGQGLTHCSNHQDPHPSLNVSIKDDRLLVHCQATCSQGEVIASLREKHLWPEEGPPVRQDTQRSIVASYDYRNATGELVFQTLRFFPKGFSQRRPDGQHGWIWNLKDVQPVLYRLPDVLAANPRQTVYVVEGEKDADRLWADGLVATSSPMGAGKWRQAYAESLRDRRVVILPDNDMPGQEHAQTIVKSLRGIAASVRVANLPDLAEHGDVSDWLDTGHTLDDLRAATSPVPRTWNAAELMRRSIPEPRWAIPGLIAEGLTVLAGRPKFGKSWIALQMALAVSYGGRALSQIKVDQGEALYLGLEDNERRLQARLHTVVGDSPDPDHLYVYDEWPRLDDGGLEALELWLDEHPRTRLVVLDTWTLIRSRPPKGADAYFEDTNAARRVKRLADERHIAIIVLHHTRKPFMGGSVADFLDEVLGSSGLTAAADSILVLQRQRGERNGVLHLTGRDIIEESRALEWDDATCWSLGGSAAEAHASAERHKVLSALREADEPITPTQLASHMGKSASAVKALLWKMSRDAQVLNDGNGHYSAPEPVDTAYLAKSENSSNCGNPGNRVTGEIKNGTFPVTAPEAAVTVLTNPVTRLPQSESRLPGLPSRARAREDSMTSCAACGGALDPREQHWPWLHNDCKVESSGGST